MRRSGVRFTAFSTPTIIATLGPYTSASIRPTRHPSACIASARFTATVDLPTPPLPLATATICLTPAMRARLRHSCRRSRRGRRRLLDLHLDGGHTRHRRDRRLHVGDNFLDDFGFRRRHRQRHGHARVRYFDILDDSERYDVAGEAGIFYFLEFGENFIWTRHVCGSDLSIGFDLDAAALSKRDAHVIIPLTVGKTTVERTGSSSIGERSKASPCPRVRESATGGEVAAGGGARTCHADSRDDARTARRSKRHGATLALPAATEIRIDLRPHRSSSARCPARNRQRTDDSFDISREGDPARSIVIRAAQRARADPRGVRPARKARREVRAGRGAVLSAHRPGAPRRARAVCASRRAFTRRAFVSDIMTWNYKHPDRLDLHLRHDREFIPWMARRGINAFSYIRHAQDTRLQDR